jgi:hypothetical protein
LLIVNRNSSSSPFNHFTVPARGYDAGRKVRAEYVVPITATYRTGAQQAAASIPQGVVKQSRRLDNGNSPRINDPRHSQQPRSSGAIVRDSGYHSRIESRTSTSRAKPRQPAILARSKAVNQTTSSAAPLAIMKIPPPKKALKELWVNSLGRAKGSFTGFFKSSKEPTMTENASNSSTEQTREAPTNGFMVGFSQKSGLRDFHRDEVMRELNQVASTASSRIVQAPVASGSTAPTQASSRMSEECTLVAQSHVDVVLMLAQCLGCVTQNLVLPTF